MMASSIAGAVFHGEVDWNAIDWPKVYRNVRRLQVRIVKATKEGRWGKVKALQRLLTHSFSGKVLAIKRVTENEGKRSRPCKWCKKGSSVIAVVYDAYPSQEQCPL